MSIYDLNYQLYRDNMLPPQYRVPIFSSWLWALLKPLQWLRDTFFYNYAESATYTYWDGITALHATQYQLIRFINGAVWEAQIAIADITTDNPFINTTNWVFVQADSIGLRERVQYNAQRILFEYLLNRYFNPTDVNPFPLLNTNGIYIVNNPNSNAPFYAGLTIGSYIVSDSVNARQYVTPDGLHITYYNFTIYVPNNAGRDGVAVFDALGDTNTNRENFMRSIAEKYNIAGYNYKIKTY